MRKFVNNRMSKQQNVQLSWAQKTLAREHNYVFWGLNEKHKTNIVMFENWLANVVSKKISNRFELKEIRKQ